MVWKAYTTDDQTITEHKTQKEAKKAANARSGPYGQWQNEAALGCWTKGEERDLYAIMWKSTSPERDRALLEDFGADFLLDK